MDKREIAHRTSEARRLLDEPLLNEALDRMEKAAIEELIALRNDNDRGRFDLVCHLRVIRGFRKHLEAVVINGETALRAPIKVA